MADAPAIFERYAADPEVSRLMGYPCHESIDDTTAFLTAAEKEWANLCAGAYLIFDADGTLVGSSGLHVETPYRASTGYVLARDMWGHGYATEAASGIARIAFGLGIRRLYALCHSQNRASAHVLQKTGFEFEGVLRRYMVFPNLDWSEPHDVECWAKVS